MDDATGLTGILRAVQAYVDPSLPRWMQPRRPPVLAFLRPEGGGTEWTTVATALRRPFKSVT